MGSNREKSNSAIAILEKLPFLDSHFTKKKCTACPVELYEFEIEKHKSERVCNLDTVDR